MVITDKHIIVSTAPLVRQVVAPLYRMGFKYFHFARVSLNKLTGLTAHETWFKHGFAKELLSTANMGHTASGCYLWSTYCTPTFIEETRAFGLDHGFTLLEQHDKYYDAYGFATDNQNVKVLNASLNNMTFLKRFVRYFQEKAAPLIRRSEKKPVILSKPMITLGADPALLPANHSDIINEQNTALPISNNGLLTRRELDCLRLLVKGLSAKEMARVLAISHRTVESYIDSIKLKTGHTKLTQLVAYALTSELRYFI